ncbi:MAG: HlyD family efflux transporter periplasmic adaptor subunit [Halocynthiibacter sp.]
MTTKTGTSSKLPLADSGKARGEHPKQGAQKSQPRRKWYRLVSIPILLLTFMCGGVSGLYFQPEGLQRFFRTWGLEPGGGTDTPIAIAIEQVSAGKEVAVVSEGDVVALGRVIPRGDVVTVSPPYGAGDARIQEISALIGDQVQRGTVLAVLDNLPQLQSALATAQADLAVKEASVLQIKEATRASEAEARAGLERAQATAAAGQAELERAKSLFDRGVTTRAVLDTAQARADETSRDVAAAEAKLSRYVANGGTVQADIAVAEANVTAAQANVDRAMLDVETAYVRAPIDGTVLNIHARPGERPDNDGILSIGNTSQMAVEAEVYQTLIGRVTIGDPVTITAEALETALNGTISAIGLEIGRQSITSDDPVASTDARVVDVIILLDEKSSKAAERFTNLQVVALIDAGREDN